MIAYLVDPEKKWISEIDLPDNDDFKMMTEMRRIIGCDNLDHITISDNHDSIWVDDVGLVNGKCWAWKLKQLRDLIAGKGIVISADDAGITRRPTPQLLAFMRRDVKWLGEIIPEITTVQEPSIIRCIVTRKKA